MENILLSLCHNAHPIVLELHIITKLIVYFNILMWLLPPLKQFKGGYFFYFVILALTDPLANIQFALTKLSPFYFYGPASAVLLLSSLYYIHKLNKSSLKYYLLLFLVCTMLVLLYRNLKTELILLILIHSNISLFFIYRFYEKYFYRNIMYVYLLVLIFYEFTIVLKLFVFLFDVKTGAIFMYSMDILEFFICFYFIFFNFKNSGKIEFN
jgi:hypothetical protein